jgi:sporulation protein YlmC with PRC-barrel domain
MVDVGRLFWKKAYTSDAYLLGEVQSVDVDTTTWQVTNLYVGLTDEATAALGFKRPFLGRVVICLPVSLVASFTDSAVLNKTRMELEGIRECKA